MPYWKNASVTIEGKLTIMFRIKPCNYRMCSTEGFFFQLWEAYQRFSFEKLRAEVSLTSNSCPVVFWQETQYETRLILLPVCDLITRQFYVIDKTYVIDKMKKKTYLIYTYNLQSSIVPWTYIFRLIFHFLNAQFTNLLRAFHVKKNKWIKCTMCVLGTEDTSDSSLLCYQFDRVDNHYSAESTGYLHASQRYYGDDVTGYRTILAQDEMWGHVVWENCFKIFFL